MIKYYSGFVVPAYVKLQRNDAPPQKKKMRSDGETRRHTVPHHAAMRENVVQLTRMLPHTSTGEVQ